MASAKVTTNHDEIRRWVEERGGSPACVKGTGGDGDVGMLRIDFPGFSGEESLHHLDWDSWFEAFEANELAFLHQDQTAEGQPSRFTSTSSSRARRCRDAGGASTTPRRTIDDR